MAVRGAHINVASTPSRLTTEGTDAVGGSAIAIRNHGAESVFIGAENVTLDDGYEVLPGETFATNLDVGETLWAITAGTEVVCHVLEVGV